MKKISFALMIAVITTGLILSGCTLQATSASLDGEYMEVTSMEAKDLIDNNPDLIIIDVSPAYDMGHLPGAVNYYVGDGSLDEAIPMLDKSGKYLVYCHTESASVLGAQKLVDAGFETVYRLKGEYSGWVDAGYPIEQ